MNVFVSSVIKGFEPFREAAARAVRTLRYEVIRSEDFGARPESPQQACLQGVREADVIVLLMGQRYGDRQDSGLSATHEEFREAKERRPVLAFVQRGVQPDHDQRGFIDEVQKWQGGVSTGSFERPEDLESEVLRALHTLALARQAGPTDAAEVASRARELLVAGGSFTEATLAFAVAPAPQQQVLRPSELEDASLARDLHREALLGDRAVLDPSQGVETKLEDPFLALKQRVATLKVDQRGAVVIAQPALAAAGQRSTELPVLIEEDVRERLARAAALAGWVLDRVDPLARVTHVAPAVALAKATYLGWRTRAEHQANPSTIEMPMDVPDPLLVTLQPPVRPRQILLHQVPEVVEDLIALLRRAYRR